MPPNKWTAKTNEQLLTLIIQMYLDKPINYDKVAELMSAKSGNSYTAKAISCQYFQLKSGKERATRGIKKKDGKSAMPIKKEMKRERDLEDGGDEKWKGKFKNVKREAKDEIKQEQW
jgi:hypothetical protein